MHPKGREIKGIGASPGIAVGNAFCRPKRAAINAEAISPEQVPAELVRLREAINQTKQDLDILYCKACAELTPDEASIFEAHILMIDDPALALEMESCIRAEQAGAEQAVEEIIEGYARNFDQMEDDYFRQRASDIREIGRRIVRRLGDQAGEEVAAPEAAVLVADDLGPGEVMSLPKDKLLGIVTEKGSKTSHVAILARALGIPCVVGVADILALLEQGTPVALDGAEGVVIIDPPDEKKGLFAARAAREKERSDALTLLAGQPSITQDGKPIELWLNIGRPEEAAEARRTGAQGIGLFRTEFLFMDRSALPGEDEQEAIYRQVLSAMNGQPVVIRTLDIGADKQLAYLPMPPEENPFLGVRGVRLCLREQAVFRAQLRALLRASAAGNLWIMFPMITVMAELIECRAIFQEVRDEVIRSSSPVAEHIKVGIMVETPAVALMADRFAQQADFFSIGTNDLIQYTMAADRQNAAVNYLNDPLNPAVAALIANTVRAAQAHTIPVGVCGEMAGNPEFTEYLVGLGLEELSMSAGSLLKVKEKVRAIDSQAAAAKAAGLLIGR